MTETAGSQNHDLSREIWLGGLKNLILLREAVDGGDQIARRVALILVSRKRREVIKERRSEEFSKELSQQ